MCAEFERALVFLCVVQACVLFQKWKINRKNLIFFPRVLGRLVRGVTTPRAHMASKRTHDNVQHIPEGFKIINEDSDTPRVVTEEYHLFNVVKAPVVRVWFKTTDDDEKPTQLKTYINVNDLSTEDQDFLRRVDGYLADTAKLLDRKHSPLVDKDDVVKLTAYLKLSKRRKHTITNGEFLVTGKFAVSSVFDFNGYYGANLVVPKKEKKCVFSQVSKPKVDDKVDDEDEE
jgi:hypothetical protein